MVSFSGLNKIYGSVFYRLSHAIRKVRIKFTFTVAWEHVWPARRYNQADNAKRNKCGKLLSSTECALCVRMSRRWWEWCALQSNKPAVKPSSASFCSVLSMQDFCIICLSAEARGQTLRLCGGGPDQQRLASLALWLRDWD